MPTPTNNSFADLDPSLLSMPGMAEFTPDVTQDDLLQQGVKSVMPLQQLETLAVDPSASQAEREKQDDLIRKAIGAVSLQNESLNYEDLKVQAQVEKARATAAHVQTQQHQQAMDVMDPFGTKAKKADDDRDLTAAKKKDKNRSSGSRNAIAA